MVFLVSVPLPEGDAYVALNILGTGHEVATGRPALGRSTEYCFEPSLVQGSG